MLASAIPMEETTSRVSRQISDELFPYYISANSQPMYLRSDPYYYATESRQNSLPAGKVCFSTYSIVLKISLIMLYTLLIFGAKLRELHAKSKVFWWAAFKFSFWTTAHLSKMSDLPSMSGTSNLSSNSRTCNFDYSRRNK